MPYLLVVSGAYCRCRVSGVGSSRVDTSRSYLHLHERRILGGAHVGQKQKSILVALVAAGVFASAASAQLAKDQQVEVEWVNKWYPATVLAVEGTKTQVRYTLYGDRYDEWVTSERLRTSDATNAPTPVSSTALRSAANGAVVQTTPEQVYADAERNETAAKAKYLGRQVTVRGTLTRTTINESGTLFAAEDSIAWFSIRSNYFTPVRCLFSADHVDELKALNNGDVVTVTGTGDTLAVETLILKNCRVGGTSAAAPKVQKATRLPANPPMGTYAVYQGDSTGFAFQHDLTLASGGQYRTQYGSGTYSYNVGSKRLSFKSGPLNGFGGLYYTKGENADNEPTIALNALGPVHDVSGFGSDVLQFAKYKP